MLYPESRRFESFDDSGDVGTKPVALVLRVQLERLVLSPDRRCSKQCQKIDSKAKYPERSAKKVPVRQRVCFDEGIAATYASNTVNCEKRIPQVVKHAENKIRSNSPSSSGVSV